MAISVKPEPECGRAANDPETRPQLLALNVEGIPDELKAQKRWAPFKAPWVSTRGKYEKIPMSPSRPKIGLSTSQPDQWVSFDEARASYEANSNALSGVGYVMTRPHGIVGYDLDGCVKDGVIDQWALEVAKALNSHTEFSLSGKGLRIFCRGKLSEDWVNHSVGLEAYAGNSSRFLTVTGCLVDGFPFGLTEPNQSVHEEIASQFRKTKSAKVKAIDSPMPEIIEGVRIPDGLPQQVVKFLADGEHDGDRSGGLFATGVSLLSAGLSKQEAFSILASNEFAMEVALDHRHQDSDRALAYLWKEQVLKASSKATAVASPNDFEDVSVGSQRPLPPFDRDKQGAITKRPNNIRMAIERPDIIGISLGYDNFRQEVMLHKGDAWRPFDDVDYYTIELSLDRIGFNPVAFDSIRRAVHWVANKNQFDSAIDWANSLNWDGTKRVDSFLNKYLGADESPYTQAVSRYLWTALAGRALEPGCKADMVPVFVGDQGIMKSTIVAGIAPRPEFYAEVSFLDSDKEIIRKMRGKMVLEIAELVGLSKRERNHVKSFISTQADEHRANFAEMSKKLNRRGLFIGTTNDPEFLDDPTGSRRFLPVLVTKGDIESLQRDRDQLWAEAVFLFSLIDGIAYSEAETLARAEHEQFAVTEEWAEVIAEWFRRPVMFYEIDQKGAIPVNGDRRYFTSAEIAGDALNIPTERRDKRTGNRIGAAMRQLGFKYIKGVRTDSGERIGAWVKT